MKRIKTFRRLEDQKSEMIEFHKRVIQTAEFKNSKWLFDGRAVTLSLPIPAKEQSINAHLVQVSFTVCLRVCSMFCRDVVVEFPIQICHQSAISIETLASLQSTEEPSAPPPPPPMEAPPLPPVTQLPISSAADRILSLGESSSSLRREDRAEMHESANELNSRLQLEEKTIEKPETIIDKMFSRFDLENEKWTS